MQTKDKQLKSAAQCSAALSAATRRLCASRLIALADSLSKAPGKGKQQQQQQQQQLEAAAAAQQQQGRHDYVSEVVAYVDEAAQSPGASLLAEEASEAAEQALGVLSLLRQALTQRLQGSAAGGEDAARLKSLQHLAGLMTLQALGDPEAADASAAQDLEQIYRVAFEGAAPAGACAWPQRGRLGTGFLPEVCLGFRSSRPLLAWVRSGS